MEELEEITTEERVKRIVGQQKRYDAWLSQHYCSAYNSEYCPRTCQYAVRMDRKDEDNM